MFAPERIRIIKGILLDKNYINVSDLSTLLNVSEVTIRRDLEKLEKEKFLTRTHGGAIINDITDDDDDDYEDLNDDPYFDERIEIAEIASHMVEDEDVIFLSSGLTNICIAKKILSKKNITVLTNDLNIASELSSSKDIKVIIPGGDLDARTMTLSGKLTIENIKHFYVSKAFIEVDGVSFQRGYTVRSIEKASIIEEMIKLTAQCIIVCHYKCFNQIAFSQIGPLSLSNKLITNPKISDEYKKYYFENNIQLFTSFNAYEGGK